MILVIERGTTEKEMGEILGELRSLGLGGNVLGGAEKPLIHLTSGRTRRARRLLRRNERVLALIPTSGPRIRRQGRRFYPYHFLNWCAAGLLVLGLLVVLAGFFPSGVGADADVRRPLLDVPAPWYLRAPAAVLALAPDGMRWLGWLVLVAVGAIVILVPVLDRRLGRAPLLVVGAALTLAYLGLTLWGAF